MSKSYKSYKKNVLKAIEQAEKRILEAIGIFVEGETIVRTPVDTGNLKGSYNHKVDESAKSVTIGSPIEYALFVEKGTSKQTAQPHLLPAVEENIYRIKKLAMEMMQID